LALALASAAPTSTPAPTCVEKVYLTVDEALKLAFPECVVDKEVLYLTDEQLALAKKLSGVEIESGLLRPYVAKRDGKLVGVAYVDLHRVRTLKESVFIVVDPEGKIARIELLSFGEPLEYVPRTEWWGQFKGKALDDELQLKRGIRGVAGATLSSRSAVDAARRVLALHKATRESAR